MIVIASAFRNAEGYIDRYAAQVRALLPLLPQPARLVLAEADSADDTAARLAALDLPGATIINRDNGSPWFGSVDRVERWRAIAYVWDGILAEVRDDDDLFILIESDLIWSPDALLRLIGHIGDGIDGAAPMVRFDGRFYDTFGHRRQGMRFGIVPPYHPTLPPSGLAEIDSAGSCLVVRAAYARAARFGDEGPVTWCNNMRAAGARLWVDLDTWIDHPPY